MTTPQLRQQLGKNIRLARTAADLTQAQLGKRCGVSQNLIYTAELGKTDPGVLVTAKIAQVCGVPFMTLLAGVVKVEKANPNELLKALLEKLR